MCSLQIKNETERALNRYLPQENKHKTDVVVAYKRNRRNTTLQQRGKREVLLREK